MIETFADLCVVTAIDVEFKIAADLLSGKSFSEEAGLKICRGFFSARRVTALQTEMGAVGFAERLAKHLESNRYGALIVAGLAGGLDPKLRVGDAVVYDFCYDARSVRQTSVCRDLLDGALGGGTRQTEACRDLLDGALGGDTRQTEVCRTFSDSLFDSVIASGLRCVRGSGVTVSRIITEAKSKLEIGARCGAVAVDMETYEALSACARFNLPAAALRVISDEAARDIPDFNHAYDADGRMDGWRMAGVMISRPVTTLSFLLSFRRALRSLKESLRAALEA